MTPFLLQPYPFNDNFRRKLIVCAGVGLFVTFFLGVFEPFGIGELPATAKWTHALAFGAITFVIASFFQVGLPRLIPALFREEGWRSWKEILYLLTTTVCIGAGNYMLMVWLYPQNIRFANFLYAQLITLQVGIFPVLFVVFLKQVALYRRYAASAVQASARVQVVTEAERPAKMGAPDPPAEPQLLLRGDNQKEELLLRTGELLYISSADNYVQVWLKGGAGPSCQMLRGSLKKMEEQLAAHPQFFRCHRMYLVNLHLVENVTGNAQGLKLQLSGANEAVPVSRNLTETVKEKLQQLSRSPQNA